MPHIFHIQEFVKNSASSIANFSHLLHYFGCVPLVSLLPSSGWVWGGNSSRRVRPFAQFDPEARRSRLNVLLFNSAASSGQLFFWVLVYGSAFDRFPRSGGETMDGKPREAVHCNCCTLKIVLQVSEYFDRIHVSTYTDAFESAHG